MGGPSTPQADQQHGRFEVRLAYTPPFDWPAVLAFLQSRAIAGVEHVDERAYRRAIRTGVLEGDLEVAHDAAAAALVASVRGLPPDEASSVARRVRWMFDLDADLPNIAAHLARDPAMAPLVAARPALRVFRGWDGFEVAARSVIGQQITVSHARQLNGVLVERCAQRMREDADHRLVRLFPAPQHVLDADLSGMGMPGARIATLKTVAAAALDDPRLFDSSGSIEATTAKLRAIRGIGDWTAHYIAMRACGEPDAFPASDIGLLRGAADVTGRRPTAKELRLRAEAWRPFRAYAAHQLWGRDAAGSTGRATSAARR
jgi:AraC family transcriptional regulator, regulatory protein of adaptative response / DNA-3-methyladenine glycosylase II